VKDQLYLLRPGFMNAGLGPLYCGDSAPVEVHYLEFPRPRAPLVEALGEAHQGVPVLILAPDAQVKDGGISPRTTNGHRFLDDEGLIRRYLSTQYDQPLAG